MAEFPVCWELQKVCRSAGTMLGYTSEQSSRTALTPTQFAHRVTLRSHKHEWFTVRELSQDVDSNGQHLLPRHELAATLKTVY